MDVDAALATTKDRGRRRLRARRLALAGCAAVVALVGTSFVLASDGGEDRRITAGPGPTTDPVPTQPPPGDRAVWTTDPAREITAASTGFTALVERVGCNGGDTGTVHRPGVVFSEDEVVVTFTVERSPEPTAGRCRPFNDPVPYEVDLGQAVGTRTLVDGTCRPADQDLNRWCRSGGVIGTPSASAFVAAEPAPGDSALWTLEPDGVVPPTATTFTALVRQAPCSGAGPPTVLRPGVLVTDDEITVSFTVERRARDAACRADAPVPYEVDIGRPLGTRALVDGHACRDLGGYLACAPGATIQPATAPVPGATAVWTVHPRASIEPDHTSVIALVTRLACNSGVTGAVNRPGIEFSDTEVVITFTVEPEPDPGPGRCLAQPVRYVVELGQALGARSLVDGPCRDGAAPATLCDDESLSVGGDSDG
jgi:hypothetical protein